MRITGEHLLLLCISLTLTVAGGSAQDIRVDLSDISFKYEEVTGIGHEKGCTRRDPSDVIKVGDSYYVYYTKIYGRSPGYWGTLWYARSNDEGYTWEEQGEILGLGNKGKFDSQATFTPNILYAEEKYWLYYTGVKPTPGNKKGEFENNSTTDITAIGVAVSSSPDGPFTRLSEDPILEVSSEHEKFDSYRVDDAALLYRNGLYWLYYKGRSRSHGSGGPGHTQMGVAFSKRPGGPFEKLDKPILTRSHEVLIWPQGTGVAALASLSSTFEYAADGIDFTGNPLAIKAIKRPIAPGLYRHDLIKPVIKGETPKWGIGLVLNRNESYLIRFEFKKTEQKASSRNKPQIYLPEIVGKYKPIFKPNLTKSDRKGKWYTNDHCFIKGDDGKWHAYGIIGKKPAQPWDGEKNLFHISSDSLPGPWEEHEYALTVNEAHDIVLWEPHVIKHNGQYRMYYAGGNRQKNARSYCSWGTIHHAVSKDLFTWKRSDYNPIISEPGHARDAFIGRFNGKFYIYYTRTYDEVDRRSVVAVRESPDLLHWGPFKRAHVRQHENDWGGDAESPYVVQYEDLYYLFVCTTHLGYDKTAVYWSTSPIEFPNENEVCVLGSHAAEIIYDNENGWFISNTGWNRDGLYIAELKWEKKSDKQ